MERLEIYNFETIPTKLRLKKGNVQINYCELNDDLGYKFELFRLKDEKTGAEIVKEISEKMCNQSYDHGSEWRLTSVEMIERTNYVDISETWIVKFRIRDSY